LRARYEAAGISVEIVSPNLGGSTDFADTEGTFAERFRALGAEIVHANTLQSFWAISAAEHAGIPSLWTVHESEAWESYYDYLSPDVKPAAYASFRYPYRVIFVSDASRRVWQSLDSHHNFVTIHNGIDIARLQAHELEHERQHERARLGISESELAAVLLGTVCERKGQLDLVRALARLPIELRRRLRTFIVGDRPSKYSNQLHAEVAALPPDLRDRLIIIPETAEPYRFLCAADIALCCSRVESYPLVTLEAMAFSLPLITTPVFGITEQVREDVNALFYQPGDVSALAKHLMVLASYPVMRARLASNATHVLASLPNLDDQLDSYGRLYQEARLSGGQRIPRLKSCVTPADRPSHLFACIHFT
jgi:glycosyltransferase involved in cell wall biosynthesis